MPTRLDDKDHAIIRLLERDSRTPLKALAAAVGLSTSTVHDRVQRLERDGVIRAFTIDVGDAGHGTQAYFFVKTLASSCASVAPRLRHIPELVRCDSVAGDIDLVLFVRAVDSPRVQQIRDEIAATEGVEELVTAPCLTRRF
ncbi:MAG: Lrp/AsnC family transcriptional regulator [Myxococcales bacterium FL481]|nr:MAG: Lrp/AsnC family transcriptional regulator [Myxococcales bacterium FL481]